MEGVAGYVGGKKNFGDGRSVTRIGWAMTMGGGGGVLQKKKKFMIKENEGSRAEQNAEE